MQSDLHVQPRLLLICLLNTLMVQTRLKDSPTNFCTHISWSNLSSRVLLSTSCNQDFAIIGSKPLPISTFPHLHSDVSVPDKYICFACIDPAFPSSLKWYRLAEFFPNVWIDVASFPHGVNSSRWWQPSTSRSNFMNGVDKTSDICWSNVPMADIDVINLQLAALLCVDALAIAGSSPIFLQGLKSENCTCICALISLFDCQILTSLPRLWWNCQSSELSINSFSFRSHVDLWSW